MLLHNEGDIPAQAIAEVTGHRSLAIRRYKHTKAGLKRKVSGVLTGNKMANEGVKPTELCCDEKL